MCVRYHPSAVYLAVASFPSSCRAHCQLRSSVARYPDCNFLRWWKHTWMVPVGRSLGPQRHNMFTKHAGQVALRLPLGSYRLPQIRLHQKCDIWMRGHFLCRLNHVPEQFCHIQPSSNTLAWNFQENTMVIGRSGWGGLEINSIWSSPSSHNYRYRHFRLKSYWWFFNDC